MKNAHKRQRWTAFMTFLFLAFLSTSLQSYSLPGQLTAVCDCSEPYNLSLTGRTSTSISFAWEATGNPGSFNVWYYRSEDNFTSTPVATTSLSHTFSDLPAGTYDIYVEATCKSGGVVLVDVIL